MIYSSNSLLVQYIKWILPMVFSSAFFILRICIERKVLGDWFCGYCSTCLGFVFNSNRILVWITRSERRCHKSKLGNSHIIFYRKLGFYPSNPLHLPLEQMVPSELVKSMREAIEPETVGKSCKEFVGECSQEISLRKVIIEKNKCFSCFMEGENILIECKLKKCGLIMCIMCYSQFGVNIGKQRCVFHTKKPFMTLSAVKEKIKSYHELLGTNICFNNNIVLRQRSHKEWMIWV